MVIKYLKYWPAMVKNKTTGYIFETNSPHNIEF